MIDSSDEDEEQQCPGCGLTERLWPKPGVIGKDGELHCCMDCAEGRVCVCSQKPPEGPP